MRADVRTPLADPYDMARPGRRRALAVLGAMPVLLTTWPARGELLGAQNKKDEARTAYKLALEKFGQADAS
ncbi:hypothetical protein ACQUWX_04920, partial [Ralstonia pseudosolanacearum]